MNSPRYGTAPAEAGLASAWTARRGESSASLRLCASSLALRNFASLQPANTNQFAPLKRGSLQAIVHSYKAAVIRWFNRNSDTACEWQPRYYEHITRTDEPLRKIRAYIHSNPPKWTSDELNRENADR